jgi:hypothetical protein
MGIIAPAIVTVSPSFMEPDTIMQYSQVSGAFELLPKGMPRVKIASDDLAVYAKRLDLRTKMSAGQAAYNMLPTVEPVFSLISTPTYLTRVRYEYDHHDAASAARWGHAITELYRLGSRQAHFQFMRTAELYGINPALGEGLANAAGATSTNLPADSEGDTTIVTYDNGQMALYLLGLIGAIKTRTNNLGIGRSFTILAPQRVLQQWEYNVVQLVQFQRPGAGTESTAGMVKIVAGVNEDDIKWCADDTLIGKGSGSTDLIMIVMPEIEVVQSQNEINTNEFAKLTPGFLETTVQYCDMVAPREITAPLPGGAVDTLSEHRISSGWAVRPEGVTLLSATYQ